MASSQALREAWESRLASLRAASNSGADPTSVLSLKRDAEDKVGESHVGPPKRLSARYVPLWGHGADCKELMRTHRFDSREQDAVGRSQDGVAAQYRYRFVRSSFLPPLCAAAAAAAARLLRP